MWALLSQMEFQGGLLAVFSDNLEAVHSLVDPHEQIQDVSLCLAYWWRDIQSVHLLGEQVWTYVFLLCFASVSWSALLFLGTKFLCGVHLRDLSVLSLWVCGFDRLSEFLQLFLKTISIALSRSLYQTLLSLHPNIDIKQESPFYQTIDLSVSVCLNIIFV